VNFEATIIVKNLIALAVIWAVLLTYPPLGYIPVAACAVLGLAARWEYEATTHFINFAVGMVLWTLAVVWPMFIAWLMTAMITLNVAIVLWISRPSPMATRS